MATDLFEILGPLSEEKARRIVMLLGLTPAQRLAAKKAEKAPQESTPVEPAA
jgi:hypothetical protein